MIVRYANSIIIYKESGAYTLRTPKTIIGIYNRLLLNIL